MLGIHKWFLITLLLSLTSTTLCDNLLNACILTVDVSAPYLDPNSNESVTFLFELCNSGKLTGVILDRDGYPVATLADLTPVASGKNTLRWNGRFSGSNLPVPDEAYSLKLDLVAENRTFTYFPANEHSEHIDIAHRGYNRRDGVLRYNLPKASRVHVQAGTATVDPKTNEVKGPVLKTIVSREPRNAGSVLESWDGRDESGTIFIPDLQDFAIAVAATPLPENSVIVFSNRSEKFENYAVKRTGNSLLNRRELSGHHQGLTALEDHAPEVMLKPLNATFVKSENMWVPKENNLIIEYSLKGTRVTNFTKQPGVILLFVDKELVHKIPTLEATSVEKINLEDFSAGNHVVSVNAASHYGPTGVNSFLIKIDKKQDASTRGRN